MSLSDHDNLNQWARAMEAQMAHQRGELRARPPEQVAHRSGAIWDPAAGTLALAFMQQPLVVPVPDYDVQHPDGSAAPTMLQALATAYLLTADGTPRAGEWVAFRELPDGVFYHRAFTGYTGGVLTRTLGDDLDAVVRGAQSAGGEALDGFGDVAYAFRVLPRLWLAMVYWLGDKEDGFPPQASVLFDRAASHYMILDGLAIIGSQLTRRILAGARA
jgi:hypothetical protein